MGSLQSVFFLKQSPDSQKRDAKEEEKNKKKRVL
jgi:hypothetical protein